MSTLEGFIVLHHSVVLIFSSSIPAIASVSLSSILLLLLFCLNRSEPLQVIPGPIIARWTPLWLAFQARRGRRYLAVNQLHIKYGPVVRIAPRHFSIADPTAIDIVYAQGKFALDKSRFYDAFVAGSPSVFSTTSRAEHSRKRKLISHAFSKDSLEDCAALMQDIVHIFVNKLDEISRQSQSVNILQWFHFLSFDILSDLAFGKRIGMIDQGSDVVIVESLGGKVTQEHAISLVDEREHLAAVNGLVPWLRCLSSFIPDPFFVRGRKSSHGLVDLSRREIMDRLQSGLQRPDILQRLIDAYKVDSDQLGPESLGELIADVVTLLIAGSDTTSNSIAAIIYLIVTNPKVHKKLLAFLEEAVHETNPNYEEVKSIPYLDAVIDEGLRYHATAAIGLHRRVPDGGVMCCGHYFPAGTELSIPGWTIQHDKTLWGDPEVFRPERWIEDPSLRKYFMTFGKGPRACV
ncbi:benzoate para-hydroxylase, partial [Hygrophoropsis aurantiaca]